MSTQQPTQKAVKPVPRYGSCELFQGGKVVLIVHEGREYWLRITSAGKLILTA